MEIHIFAVFNSPDMPRIHLEIAFQKIKQNIDHECIPFLYHFNQTEIHFFYAGTLILTKIGKQRSEIISDVSIKDCTN